MLTAVILWVIVGGALSLTLAAMPKMKGKRSLELGRLPAEPARSIVKESAVAQTVRPFDMVVREIGEATVVIREVRGRMASALLVVWAGKTRQIGCDSTYQLGTTSASSGLSDDVISAFVARAAERLRLITEEGIKKREEKRSARAASRLASKDDDVPNAAIQDAIQLAVDAITEGQPSVPDQSETLSQESDVIGCSPRLVPTERLLEGYLRFAGVLKRPDDEYQQFAIQVEVEPGVIRTMYGAGLKSALRRGNAVVGTRLRVEKVGRQAMPGGLKSKTLFQIVRLDAPAEAANEPVADEFVPIQFCA